MLSSPALTLEASLVGDLAHRLSFPGETQWSCERGAYDPPLTPIPLDRPLSSSSASHCR